MDNYISLREASVIFNTKIGTVRSWVNRKKIPYIMKKREKHVKEADIIKWVLMYTKRKFV